MFCWQRGYSREMFPQTTPVQCQNPRCCSSRIFPATPDRVPWGFAWAGGKHISNHSTDTPPSPWSLCSSPHSPRSCSWHRRTLLPANPWDFGRALPSVPVGQGETGPSYPGRYKAHRCKCREHLQWPPRSGSTRLPAGSSQNTAAGRAREIT